MGALVAVLPSDDKETVSGSTGVRGTPVIRDNEPKFKAPVFRCPRCDTVAMQYWAQPYRKESVKESGGPWRNKEVVLQDLAISTCQSCHGRSLWFENRLVYPPQTINQPVPHDMPEELQADFEEARAVAPHSPRAAAALLRMCVENLCKKLTDKTKFDAAIAELEAQGIGSHSAGSRTWTTRPFPSL